MICHTASVSAQEGRGATAFVLRVAEGRHVAVDSIEGITHSCCTTEFSSRQVLPCSFKFDLTILVLVLQAADGPYYWLLHVLGMYKPVTFEYSVSSLFRSASPPHSTAAALLHGQHRALEEKVAETCSVSKP